MASESIPSCCTRSSRSGIRLAPSRREYSEWVWRWTNGMSPQDIGGFPHCQNPMSQATLRPMRWVASLIALGLMMALFHRFTGAGPVQARATLALGFLFLAAQLGGDLAHRLRLPRLTGYLLTGFALGPAWLGLVRADEVDLLGLIADACLALLAFGVGSELAWERLRRGRTALLRVGTAAVAFPLVAVFAVVLSVGPWFPLTVHQPVGDVIAVALVLGVFAGLSSPVVALPLVREAGGEGGPAHPFSRMLLDVAVLQDAAALVVLAAALVIGRLAASPGALAIGVAGEALVRLGGSLAAGAAVGVLLQEYLRRLRRESPLLLVALALLIAAVAALLRLEAVLVALAAGAYLRHHATVEGTELRAHVERAIGPVAVAYVALAGAGPFVGALGELWPWVLLVAGVRALSLRYGLRWAGRSPAVTPIMARAGWLGLIPQGGLALGLAALARRAFPEWGVSLEGLVAAMIGVHLIAGPLCFRLGLRLAGEVTEGEHGAERPGASGTVVAADRGRL